MNKKLSITSLILAFWPMAVVFAWDALINNPFDLYGLWPNLDVPMHMIGGIVTALSLTRFLARIPTAWRPVIRPTWARYFFMLGLVAMVTIAWEVYELIFDFIHPFPSPMTVPDTLGDMLNGLIGANICLFVQYYTQSTRSSRQIKHRSNQRRRKEASNQAS